MNVGIRTKLLGTFAAVLALVIVVGCVGWYNTVTFSAEFADLYSNNLKGSNHLASAERGLWELRFGLPNYIAGDAAAREKIKAATAKWVQVVDDNLKAYAALPLTAAEKEALKEWEQNYPAYLRARPQFFELLDTGKLDEAKKFRAEETNPPAARAVAALARLNDLQQKIGADKDRSVSAAAGTSTKLLVGLVALAVVIGAAISLVISRAIIAPLERVVVVLDAVAQGDFGHQLEVTTTDEVGRMSTAVNDAVRAMRQALIEVSGAAEHAASASEQLAGASQQLSSGAQEQASSLEETAASLEEITGTVKQNADNARQANQLAIGSREVAEKGGQVVAEAMQSMGEINKASAKIADIITTIDEIAFQTNLLALNAAVEAARAGEQGRGFAVVAAEVRNLAQRSATAAKEIKGLIQDSVHKVQAGSELVNKSGATLTEIVVAVKRVTDIIAEIAAASQEQTTGIDQVNRAVTQMDQVTQTNAAQTEQLSSTAQSLATQANELQVLVARFSLGDHGAVAGRGPARPAPIAGARTPGKAVAKARPATTAPARRELAPAPMLAQSSATNGHANGSGFEEF